MKNDYQAGVENLDFASSASVKHINQWCSKQTNGMIPSMISQLDANAVSCIMNAIYFKGAWTDKFDKKNTKLEAFHGYTRDIKKAQMMHRQAKYSMLMVLDILQFAFLMAIVHTDGCVAS